MTLSGLVVDFFGVLTDVDGIPDREPPLISVVRAARASGLRTALLSNAEGAPDDEMLAGLFDAMVVSGEVGLFKPDPEIYRFAAKRLDLPTGACVFVDDLPTNVEGAVRAGMVGVHHRTVQATVEELAVLFDRDFSAEPTG
ncbi:HAD-IA family hydrolase [Actinoalloteichus hymeniacidonis]|uniref:HAD-IA family hydrolase n=1 Tax=Actinoalloteichus hymeniacidonis TaxID=340345 RepID=UPI001833DC6E|nr:HAD-IA family hydrolase [Actinoalloteichus hymeniacidonis]MBB5906483.1 HAD superfamily hydrolase (TIGR01509 family) [Actinoalloteichus hymeniacidonis]